MRTFFFLLALTLWLPADAVAELIDQRFVTGLDARLDLSNVSGDVQITGWDKNEVHVTGELGKNAEIRFEHEQRDVRVKVAKKRGFRRMGPTRLRVRVPLGAQLSVYAVSADLIVRDVAGEQRIEVVSGDVNINGFAQELRVKAVSGDISLVGTSVPGRVSVVSVSGDTRISDVAGDIETRSVSGNTRVSGASFDRVQVNSTSGDVNFQGGINALGRFEAEVISGDVALDLADGKSLEVDIETFSGGIRNCLGEESQRKSKYGPGRILRFSRGAADQAVRVRSMSGGVRLCAQ